MPATESTSKPEDRLTRALGGIDAVEDVVRTGWLLRVLFVMTPIAALLAASRFETAARPGWVIGLLVVTTVALLVQWVLAWRGEDDRAEFLSRHWAWTAVTFGGPIIALAVAARDGLLGAFRVLALYIVGTALLRTFVAVLRSKAIRRRPAVAIVLTFAVIIFVGATGLHVLPNVVKPGESLSAIDALFTATSATCVTGLEVVSTGDTMTRFGQSLILLLIQVGGLGIMAFGTFLLLAMGSKLSLSDRAVVTHALNVDDLGATGRMVASLVVMTLGFELVGVLLLRPIMADEAEPWFAATFHSVSAFCNAGFSLFPDSLTRFDSHVGANLVFMFLILAGGIGFTVNEELIQLAKSRFRRGEKRERKRLSLHARIALGVSGVLLLVGVVMFWVLEHDHSLAGRSVGEQGLVSLFHSVSSRTAGFASVDFADTDGGVGAPARFALTSLMLIGASPGSTGGGLKTVTFAILVLSVIAILRNRHRVEVFGRTIPHSIVGRATAVAVLYGLMVFIAIAVLILVEGEKFTTDELLFEAVSALATVGLSAGVSSSSDLGDAGKLVLTVLMFAGRVGPLTLVLLASSSKRRNDSVEFPEEKVMIG